VQVLVLASERVLERLLCFSLCVICLSNPLPVSGLLLTRSGKHNNNGSRPAKAGKMRNDLLACFCVVLICTICIAIASDCQD